MSKCQIRAHANITHYIKFRICNNWPPDSKHSELHTTMHKSCFVNTMLAVWVGGYTN